MAVGNDENHDGDQFDDDGPTEQRAEPAGSTGSSDADDLPGIAFGEIEETDPSQNFFVENEEADPTGVVAATKRKHEQKFRWWALGVIAGLCVFFALSTLLVAALASGEAAGQVASDTAKTAIPTLLTLLGTAVAWAFKSEKDS